MNAAHSPLLNVQEACQYCCISPRHLRDLRAEGTGPKAVRLGRRLLFRREDLDHWILANSESARSGSDHTEEGDGAS
jgi:excisionase family DNA binding protein